MADPKSASAAVGIPTFAEAKDAWYVRIMCQFDGQTAEYRRLAAPLEMRILSHSARFQAELDAVVPELPRAERTLSNYRPATEEDAHLFLHWQRRAKASEARLRLRVLAHASASIASENARPDGPRAEHLEAAHRILDRYGPDRSLPRDHPTAPSRHGHVPGTTGPEPQRAAIALSSPKARDRRGTVTGLGSRTPRNRRRAPRSIRRRTGLDRPRTRGITTERAPSRR